MIPGDLASRLRMLTEASFFSGEPNVAPLARVKGISGQLPDFSVGQRIVATLQSARPDKTFLAQVEGREVTLALPQSVKAGDTLELVVSHVTPKAVFATLAPPANEAASRPALSQAGKLIGFLLTGQPAPETPRLNGGAALLPAAPQSPGAASTLATSLAGAVQQSGLFYESHQARWLAGQIDTATLQLEPQGKAAISAAARATVTEATPYLAPGSTETAESPSGTTPLRPQAEQAAPIPERLLPLVHQQLDAIATQHIVWQGQVWPGQNMEWEIEEADQERRNDDGEPDPRWNTTLRLTLPGLGGVEAQLHLTPAGVAVRLIADSEATRDALDAAQGRLAEALDAANVPLTGLVAERRSAA